MDSDPQSILAPPGKLLDYKTAPNPSQMRGRTYTARALIWLLITATLAFSFHEGIHLRRWAFELTDPIRYLDDIHRGCYWGLTASGPEGYLNQYDKMQDQKPDWEDSRWVPWLDYAPLRLLVMRQWGAWQRVHFPPDPDTPLMQAWQHSYAFNAPMLWFNTAMEIFAAFCAFCLTRIWVVRGSGGKPRHHFDGVWQGIVAALLIWFSPDILLSAHAWITWDSWVVPWYLCVALLASLDWWFAAGLVMAVGAMFKAQELTVAPIFIIWPLVQWRFGAAARWLTGLTFGIAVIASGWMLTYLPANAVTAARQVQEYTDVASYPRDLFAIPRVFDVPAAIWIGELILVAATAPWILRNLLTMNLPPEPSRLQTILHSRWTWAVGVLILITMSIYWPFLLRDNRPYWYIGVLGAAALAAASISLRPRHQPFVLAGVAGAGLLLCMLLFHGGTGWARCTFQFGTVHWPFMVMGLTDNIPGIFEIRFGWPHAADDIAFTLPAIASHWPAFITSRAWWPAMDVDVSAKTLFDTIYFFFLLLSGIAVGLQARRKDRRMLVALVTPWIMFFLWPVQIHERYLLFAAGAAVCCIGNSVGTCLLGLCLTACSAIMHLDLLMTHGNVDQFGQNLSNALPWLFSPDCGQTIQNYLAATHPDMGWGVLVIGLVFLYLSLTPSPRQAKRG
jgi:hypothetical protein